MIYRLLLSVLIAAGCWLAAASSAHAEVVQNLSRTDILVADMSASTRRDAMRDGLAEILIRLSGQSALLMEPAVDRLMRDPENYVLQYRYEEAEEPGDAAPGKRLWLNYDLQALLGFLKRESLPIWSSNRPQVLLWWAVEQNGQRQVLNSENEHPLRARLRDQAERRGVPIQFPIWDFEERQQVGVSDIWGQFTDNIAVASQRYGLPTFMVGKLVEGDNGVWRASWLFRFQQQEFWGQASDPRIEAVLARAVDSAANRLADHYAVIAQADDANTVTIAVTHVQQLEDYARLTDYLEQLVPVKRAVLKQVDGDTLQYSLILNVDWPQLQETLKLDRKLAFVRQRMEVETPPTDSAEQAMDVPASSQPPASPQPTSPEPTIPAARPENTSPILEYRWRGSSR